MKKLHFPTSLRIGFLGLLLTTALTSCGGTDICKCLEEADKQNPDQAVMEKCRDAFSKMEMDEVDAAVKKCGR